MGLTAPLGGLVALLQRHEPPGCTNASPGACSRGIRGALRGEVSTFKCRAASTAARAGLTAIGHACFRQTARRRGIEAIGEVSVARSLASEVTRRSRFFAQQKRDTYTPQLDAGASTAQVPKPPGSPRQPGCQRSQRGRRCRPLGDRRGFVAPFRNAGASAKAGRWF